VAEVRLSHSVFTIVSSVRRDKLLQLKQVLQQIEADHATNPYLPLTSFSSLHFASLTIFDDEEQPDLDPLLVFENNIDGTIDDFISLIVKNAVAGLIEIYSCCTDFRVVNRSDDGMRDYLHGHKHRPNLYHIGTPYRLVANVLAERKLRELVDAEANRLLPGSGGRPPSWIWERLRKAVNAPDSNSKELYPKFDPEMSWIRRRERRWHSQIISWFVFVFIAVALILAASWISATFWHDQLLLSASLAITGFAVGVWTSVLVGWPALNRWRHLIAISFWFAAAGWIVSLLPAILQLSGVLAHAHPVLGPVLLGIIAVVLLSTMAGRWILPTPDLEHRVPDVERLTEVLKQEDRSVQNHMSAMVMLRPGVLRLLSLRVLLWILKLTWFPTILRDVEKGRLFSMPTVHFAQWVVLDRGRYLFFSNYDHSWSRYLDDFSAISFGLARLWGQSQRSPGLSNMYLFKDFVRTWMFPYSVWYRAYPGISVTQIWNNEQIRRSMLSAADDDESARRLRRLVAAEDR
jgi:hypothetical protein